MKNLSSRLSAVEKQIDAKIEEPKYKITTKDGLYNVDCVPDTKETPTVRGLTVYELEEYLDKFPKTHFQVDVKSLTDQELRDLIKEFEEIEGTK